MIGGDEQDVTGFLASLGNGANCSISMGDALNSSFVNTSMANLGKRKGKPSGIHIRT
jgi:hypothetical protein